MLNIHDLLLLLCVRYKKYNKKGPLKSYLFLTFTFSFSKIPVMNSVQYYVGVVAFILFNVTFFPLWF